MAGLGGSVGEALELHQDLTEGSAGHLLHLHIESLTSPVSGGRKRGKSCADVRILFTFYLSYFCFIFHRMAAMRSNARKHLME